MTPPPPPPAPPSPLCPLPLSRRPVCERGSPSLAAAAGHSGRSGAIPPSPQAGVTRTRQGKKKRCHHCGGFLRVAADNARALAWYFFLFFLPPARTRRRRDLRDGAVLCRVSFPPPIPPKRREGVAICLLVGPRRVWCHFLGKRRGRREKKKWGPSCCHTPGQTMMMMMLHLPTPPFPPHFFFSSS